MYLTLVESKNYSLLYKDCIVTVRSQRERMIPLVFKFAFDSVWVEAIVEDGRFHLIYLPMTGPYTEGFIFCTQHDLRSFLTERCVPKVTALTRVLGNIFYRAAPELWEAKVKDFGDKTFILEWSDESNAIAKRTS